MDGINPSEAGCQDAEPLPRLLLILHNKSNGKPSKA